MTRTVRTGLVGCGKIGAIHAMALNTLEQSEFVACCDIDEGRARAVLDAWVEASRRALDELG